MKKTTAKRTLALTLCALLLLACAQTAFAADIDFGDGTGNALINGSDSGKSSGTITTGDADNTISGDGSGYSVEFTHSDASVEVDGDTEVGGISATGSLTITGDSDDSLTSTGGAGQAGIGVSQGGDLTIEGELTVTAMGGDETSGVAGNGIEAWDMTIDDGATVNATGGDTSTGFAGNGIFANNMTIDGGATVTATGGDASDGRAGDGIAVGPGLTIDGGATVNATGGDSDNVSGSGVSADNLVNVVDGTLSAEGGTGSNGDGKAIDVLSGVIVNGKVQNRDDYGRKNVTLTTKPADPEPEPKPEPEPEPADPEPAEPEAAPAPASNPQPDNPPPIVAVLYDVAKTGDTFSFKTYIANGEGSMAGATVTVQLNETYETTVTIGGDGIGHGAIEAPGYAADTARFTARPNVPGGVSATTVYDIYSTGEVVRRN